MPNREMERKALPVFVTKVDGELGIVDAIVSTLGIIDHGDDMIVAGAYTKTITERGRKVRVLDAHNSYSISDVIGKPVMMREVGREELPEEVLARWPEATGGLLTSTQYALATEKGREAFALIRDGFVDEYSIGFEVMASEYRKIGDTTVRIIKEVRLWEYSPVVWGMNPATATVSVKHEQRVHTFMQQMLGEAKAGRVLSSNNAARIRMAFDALLTVMTDAGLMEDPDEEVNKAASADLAISTATDSHEAAEPSAESTAKSLTAKREELLAQIRNQMSGLGD